MGAVKLLDEGLAKLVLGIGKGGGKAYASCRTRERNWMA